METEDVTLKVKYWFLLGLSSKPWQTGGVHKDKNLSESLWIQLQQ